MKYAKNNWLGFFLVVSAILSCVKNSAVVEYTGSKSKPDLVLSKSIVKRGEPLVVSTNAPDSNSSIRWTINPSESTLIIPLGNRATIYITLPGTYRITANYYSPSDTVKAYDSSNSTITVNDSIYITPPVGSDLDTASLAGDNITLIPVSASASGFIIIAKTTRLYNCAPYITAYGVGQNNLSLDFNFRGAEIVEGKGNCMGTKNPATVNITLSPLTTGIYTVTANLNQVDYQGSLNVTDSNYTFTWNYTSGIVISPLQIKIN